jgi:DNA-directed RNA polymerase alpha subunit
VRTQYFYNDLNAPMRYLTKHLGIPYIFNPPPNQKDAKACRKSLLICLAKLKEFTPEEHGSVNHTYSAHDLVMPPTLPVFPEFGKTGESMDICELGLLTRTYNCLKGEGVKTVGELLALGRKYVKDLPNLGEASMRDLEATLAVHGLAFTKP